MEEKYVDFYNESILTIKNEHTGEVFVPLKPIVLTLSLDWASQTVKIKNNNDIWKCCVITTVANDGKRRKQVCIPLKNLNGWLLSISPNRVEEKLRSKVIKYQQECFEVLYNYWNKGVAVNPRMEIEVTNPFDIIDGVDLTRPEVALKIKKVFDAYYLTVVENDKLRKKYDEMYGSKKSKLLMDFVKELHATKDGHPLTERQVHEILITEDLFRLYKFLPYEKYNDNDHFGKVELPKVGQKGGTLVVRALLKHGCQLGHPSIQRQLENKPDDPKLISNTPQIPISRHIETPKDITIH